jgi:hypothetical protein
MKLNENFSICIISNDYDISLFSINIQTNDIYYENLSKTTLININKNFEKLSSIIEIYNMIINYIKNNINSISFEIKEKKFILSCNQFIQNENIRFILPKSNIYISNFNLKNNEIISINEIPFHVSTLKHGYLQNKRNSNVYYSRIILHIISVLLLLSLYYVSYLVRKQPFHYFTPSNILVKNDINLISQWINHTLLFNYTLLYRASINGDSAVVFHERCDRKGPTITLIQTTDDFVFGGYSQTDWDSFDDPSGWKYKKCKEAFIFSLNLKKKYPSKGEGREIFCNKLVGPTFGYGHDISVAYHCLNDESSCNSGISFTDMSKVNEFNGGKQKFIAKEVEVYSVQIKGYK